MSEPITSETDPLYDVTLPPRPYPGLRPFEKHEWPIFFGRERMADAIVGDIVHRKLLVVHGDSGCGKSSLVRAAVQPRLEQESARGGIRWRTCSTAPGESPLWNLARDVAALAAGRPDEELAIEVRRTMNFGAEAPVRLAELVGASADRQICVLIDQFEELFDHARHHGPEEAGLLTGFCTALFRNPPDGLNIIITMRSEFLGACARYGDFALTVNATQYLLPRMQHEDLLRAVREPARLYDGEVTRELAERLVADASGGQDELPLIQHGLMLLHREHGGKGGPWRLGLEHHPAGRGLKALLSDHADAVANAVDLALPRVDGTGGLIQRVFQALTDINAEGQAVRRPRTLQQLIGITGAAEAHVRQVIDAFRADGVSFLRPYGDVSIELDDRIDISHEALIRRWTRIADPKSGWLIREFRDGLIWRALLVQADSFDRDPSNVLSPTTTDERDDWMRQRTPGWSERYDGGWDRVQRLVAASRSARDRQRAEETLARVREQQSELRGQRVKYLRVGITVLGLLLVVAVYFAIQANVKETRARGEADRANRALADGEIEFSKASAARDRSEALAAEAQRSADALMRVVEGLRATGPAGLSAGQRTRDAVQEIAAVAETLKTEPRQTAPTNVGPRVYVHITDPKYNAAARVFEQRLEDQAVDGVRIIVPGIELVKSAPPRPVLRCFRKGECAGEARQILDAANRLLGEPRLELQDLSARYGGSDAIRPRHYEIWFNEGLTIRGATTAR